MSLFITKLPTGIEELIQSLPSKSHVNKVELNLETHEIYVHWENDRFVTPYTIPVEFSQKDLRAKRLPIETTEGKKKILPVEPPKQVEKPPVLKMPAPKYMNREEVEQALAKNNPLEFMGMETVWKPVEDFHKFTEGFF